jgi:hypothetical protein
LSDNFDGLQKELRAIRYDDIFLCGSAVYVLRPTLRNALYGDDYLTFYQDVEKSDCDVGENPAGVLPTITAAK